MSSAETTMALSGTELIIHGPASEDDANRGDFNWTIWRASFLMGIDKAWGL